MIRHFPERHRSRRRTALCAIALAAGLAHAQAPQAPAARNPASELARDPQTDIPAHLREQLDTIGRYAAEVNRRVVSPGQNTTPAAPAAPTARGARQVGLTGDPFEVSPQLREGRSSYRFSGLPGANVLELQRRVQLRAVIRTPQGTLAQLLINNKDVVTIMDKELLDLGDLGTFQAEIQAGTVSLSNPSSPQGKKVVLR